MGVGTKAEARAPINTLKAAWQGQAVPVKDTLGHWWGGDERFPRADARSESRNHFEVAKSQVQSWCEAEKCLGCEDYNLETLGGGGGSVFLKTLDCNGANNRQKDTKQTWKRPLVK